ncbi:uncharacterized protein METZ01_LOCUS213027, partial [marine metagenome]
MPNKVVQTIDNGDEEEDNPYEF